MKIKAMLVTAIFVLSLILISPTLTFSDKNTDALPQEIKDAMEKGLLITPQGGLVCLHSERPPGTLDFQPPGGTEIITLSDTAEKPGCPFDSGCTIVRGQSRLAIAFLTPNGQVNPPDLTEYVDVPLEPPNPPKLPKGPVNIQIKQRGLEAHRTYFFFAKGTNETGPTTAVTQQAEEIPAGDLNSQHQAPLDFTQAAVTGAPAEGEEQRCTFVAWDPYGRVFDSKSLEPLPGIRVDLIDNNTQQPVIQIEKNYDVTEADGLFNILVNTPGLYKIGVDVPLTYNFIPNPSLNPGYSKIYSDLYFPDTVYEEKQGVPTHHDIALVPKGDPYYSSGVEVMSNASGINMGDYWLYTGRVSHPFAYVCLAGETTNKLYGCDTNQADKHGVYQITINQSDFPEYESMVPVASKTSFPPSGIDMKDSKYKTSLRNNPLFGYIEGYAKDLQGNIIPNAKVQVLYSANDRLIYEVHADANGFFRFYPQELPFIEYYLNVVSPVTGNGIAVTTSSFATQNRAYLESKKVSLTANREEMKILSKGKIVSKQNTGSPTHYKIDTQSAPVLAPQQTQQQNDSLKARVVLVGIIIGVLCLAVVGVVVYLKQKKQSQDFM